MHQQCGICSDVDLWTARRQTSRDSEAEWRKRKSGIPTVTDRIIRQAIAQVLSPIYERKFSGHSYGFRPNRSAHQALKKGSEYVEQGRYFVVDMDLKTFFDVVNHDRLMYRLSLTIGDKTLLGLIRKYLQSGIMVDGVAS